MNVFDSKNEKKCIIAVLGLDTRNYPVSRIYPVLRVYPVLRIYPVFPKVFIVDDFF